MTALVMVNSLKFRIVIPIVSSLAVARPTTPA
jgi:hypothetical protein